MFQNDNYFLNMNFWGCKKNYSGKQIMYLKASINNFLSYLLLVTNTFFCKYLSTLIKRYLHVCLINF